MLQCLLCRSKNSFRDKSAWKHIGAGSHALLRFCFMFIGVSGDPQLDNVQMGDSNCWTAWNIEWNGGMENGREG